MGNRKAWLVAFCAVAGIGCSDGSGSQVLTGRITTSGALAVRAVAADSTITAAQVRSDGSFTLELPAGQRYRLEVLTTSGVRHMFSQQTSGLAALSFEVCKPVDPFDVGTVGNGMDPGDPPDKCIDPSTGEMDPNCMPPEPCDPTDPSCTPPDPCMDPMDPNCGPPKCMDPTDPDCMPPGPCPSGDPSCGTMCTDPTDPNCLPPPPPCADPTDPYCKCDASGNCPPPTCDPGDPMCPPPPPPPCADPTDPQTCQDPCMADPATCGCAMDEPNCWPPPEPPKCDASGMCDAGTGGMTPANPPGDFGCVEMPPL
ncbi:MAG: hypothetical protein ABI175_13120 [Polyangiales bacterium]